MNWALAKIREDSAGGEDTERGEGVEREVEGSREGVDCGGKSGNIIFLKIVCMMAGRALQARPILRIGPAKKIARQTAAGALCLNRRPGGGVEGSRPRPREGGRGPGRVPCHRKTRPGLGCGPGRGPAGGGRPWRWGRRPHGRLCRR